MSEENNIICLNLSDAKDLITVLNTMINYDIEKPFCFGIYGDAGFITLVKREPNGMNFMIYKKYR